MVSSVQGGKNVVSFVHSGKNSLVSFDSGVFIPPAFIPTGI